MATIASERAASHEEGEPDRHLETRPELVRQLEVVQPQDPGARGAKLRVRRALRPARRAHTEDPAIAEMEQVLVFGRNLHAAEVAVLLGAGRAVRLLPWTPPGHDGCPAVP